MKERLRGRHLISLDSWSTNEIDATIDISSELKRLRIKKKALKQRKRDPVDGRASTPLY